MIDNDNLTFLTVWKKKFIPSLSLAKKQPCDNLNFEKSPHFYKGIQKHIDHLKIWPFTICLQSNAKQKTTHELFAHESLIEYLIELTPPIAEAVLKNSEANRFRGSNCIKIGRDDRDWSPRLERSI